jgi:hypothetical protein
MIRTTRHLPAIALGALLSLSLGVVAQNSFPTRPRLTSVGVGRVAPTTVGAVSATNSVTSTLAGDGATVGAIESNSVIPQFNWFETDAAANNGHWLCGANGEQFRCRTSVDDGSAVGTWLLVDRTAQVVDTLALSATAITLNGAPASDFARLSQDNVFTQTDAGAATIANNNTNAGTGAYSQITAGNNAPRSAYMLRTSTTYASPVLTNGPSGEQSVFGSGGSFPLLIGTNDTKRIQVAGDGSLIELDATAIDSNGVDMTPASGTFTANFENACTTTPTATFDWQRIGNLVVLSYVNLSGFPCTGDSVSFVSTSTPVPAALRPTGSSATSPALPGCTDNGATTLAQIQVDPAGTIGFNRITTAGATAGWTASGNRISCGAHFAYMLGNP